MFLDHLPEKLGSELRTQILMYKSSRQSGDAADLDDDNASNTPCRLLLQFNLVRALKEHDRSVRRKAEELKLNASIADLASTSAQTAQLTDLQRQVKVLQDQLASRLAHATSSTKRPTAATAPSPHSTARALVVASMTTRTRTNTRTKDFAPHMRDCVHCHGRHMDRDCTSRPRALATSASGGPPTSSPPPPPRDLRPPAASAPVAPTANVPPHTVTPPKTTLAPDAKTPVLAARRVTFRHALLASSAPRPPAGSLPDPPAGSLPDPAAAQFFGPAAGELNRTPALFSGRLTSAALLPALTMAAHRTQHHLRVDIPPLPPSMDSKRLHTPHTPISSPACRIIRTRPRLRLANLLLPSLGRPRNCLQTRLHGSALRDDLHLCRRTLRVPQDARLRPCDVDPPPSSGPPSCGDHHLPSPVPTHAGPTQAPAPPLLTSIPAKSGVPTTTPPRSPSTPTGPTGPPHTPTQAPLAMPTRSPSPPHCQAPPLQPLTSHHCYHSPPTPMSPLQPVTTPRPRPHPLEATPRTLLPASRASHPRPRCAKHYGAPPSPCRRNTHAPSPPRPTTTSGPQPRRRTPAPLPSRAAAARGSLGATSRPTTRLQPRTRFPAILPAQATGVNFSFSLLSLPPPTSTPALSPAPAPCCPSIPRNLMIPLRPPRRLPPHPARRAWFVPTSPQVAPHATLLQ